LQAGTAKAIERMTIAGRANHAAGVRTANNFLSGFILTSCQVNLTAFGD
jgi:hypothetical protein